MKNVPDTHKSASTDQHGSYIKTQVQQAVSRTALSKTSLLVFLFHTYRLKKMWEQKLTGWHDLWHHRRGPECVLLYCPWSSVLSDQMLNCWCKKRKMERNINHHIIIFFIIYYSHTSKTEKKRSTDLMLLTLQITAEKKRTGGPIHTTKGEKKKRKGLCTGGKSQQRGMFDKEERNLRWAVICLKESVENIQLVRNELWIEKDRVCLPFRIYKVCFFFVPGEGPLKEHCAVGQQT